MEKLNFAGNWSEKDIMEAISGFREPDFSKFGGTSFCHNIIKALRQTNLLTENAGHDRKPPDYYSDELNIMFDVMRVNDSEQEIKCKKRIKRFNPAFQESAEVKKNAQVQLKNLGINDVTTIAADLKSDNGLDYDQIHQFGYYRRHVLRILNEHIEKIPVWCTEHPTIKRKGFIVLDEAGMYFQGHAEPAVMVSDGHVEEWKFFVKNPVVVHCPWKDSEFMQPLLDADLDFVIWYRPYVTMSEGNLKLFQGQYPDLAIVDLRKKSSLSVQAYDMTTEWFSWM